MAPQIQNDFVDPPCPLTVGAEFRDVNINIYFDAGRQGLCEHGPGKPELLVECRHGDVVRVGVYGTCDVHTQAAVLGVCQELVCETTAG